MDGKRFFFKFRIHLLKFAKRDLHARNNSSETITNFLMLNRQEKSVYLFCFFFP